MFSVYDVEIYPQDNSPKVIISGLSVESVERAVLKKIENNYVSFRKIQVYKRNVFTGDRKLLGGFANALCNN